jgi:ribosome-binding protein aMBF1 (putative translation factor)
MTTRIESSTGDDLDQYVSERDTREPGFGQLVADEQARLVFAQKLAARRRARGQSQTDVAAKMGTSAAIVSRLESGFDVRVSTLAKYMATLGLELFPNAKASSGQRHGARPSARSVSAKVRHAPAKLKHGARVRKTG